MTMMKTMMISQTGLDPQKNRNKCKLVWDSSSGSRARARSQISAPTTMGLVKGQTATPVIQFSQKPQTIKATVVAQKSQTSVGVVALDASLALDARARRRSISNIIADRMSLFEELKAERGNIKKKKKSVHLKVKNLRYLLSII